MTEEYLALCQEWTPTACEPSGGRWSTTILWVYGDACMTTNHMGSADPMLSEAFWGKAVFNKNWMSRKLKNQRIKDIKVLRIRFVNDRPGTPTTQSDGQHQLK